MSTDRKKTYAGLGTMGQQKLSSKGPEGSSISIPTSVGGDFSWFPIINTHTIGLVDRLAVLKEKQPGAIITSNPIAKIEKLMKNFFGNEAELLFQCSTDHGKSLNPAKFFEYLTKAFSRIVKIIESPEALQFYNLEERTVILETCQRNLGFMAAILPGVALEFEKYAAENGGVVPGQLRPMEGAPRRSITQPYLTAAPAPEGVPSSEAVPSSNQRRSSIPISSAQLYPAQARRDTVRPAPLSKRSVTLAGLDELALDFETKRDSGAIAIEEVLSGDVPDIAIPIEANVPGEHVGITTSMLPPPMVEAIAEHEAQKQLEALQRDADKEFEALFTEAYESYFDDYSKTHARAVELIHSTEADPAKRQNDVEEGEKLIADLNELMKDPEEIAKISFGLALEQMDADPEKYPAFASFYLERGKLDYNEHFNQHGKNVFSEKSRDFVDLYLPALLQKMVTADALKRDLGIHHRKILALQDANEIVPQDLSSIDEIIQQIVKKDPNVLREEWPDKLATALASQTFLSLGEALYKTKKASLVWGLYFYQADKRELADQVYQPIFDAYLPLCHEYQDALKPDIQEDMARIADEYAAQIAAESGAAPVNVGTAVDRSTEFTVGETDLSDEDLLALNEAIDNEMVIETGEEGVTYAEMQEILATEAREKNAASFGEVDLFDGFDDEPTVEIPVPAPSSRISSAELKIQNMMRSLGSDVHIFEQPAEETVSDVPQGAVIVEGSLAHEVSGEKLPPLPAFIDPNDYLLPEDYKKWVQGLIKSKDKVAEVNGYAVSICSLGGYIMAKDGWIVFEDQATENVNVTDDLGRQRVERHTRTLGRWYFRPPNTFFPVYRPASGNDVTEPVSMTVEQVQAFYNSMKRHELKALYNRSFGGKEGVADPFAEIPDNEPLFAPVITVMGSAFDGSANVEAQSQTPTDTTTVVDSGMNGDGFVQLPSAVEELGAMDESERPTLPSIGKKKQRSGWKVALAAAGMAALSAVGYNGYRASQTDSTEGPVASSSVSNSDGAKPVESAKVAEVKSAQPQPVMTAPPQNPNVPPATVVNVNDLPVRTYVADEILEKIPSKYTRAVVETGKYTVEPNGLGWAAQIATPFTRIASPKQQAQINELQHELNVGLYASSVKKYENAANVNAILMNPQHPEYARVKFLIKKNVMGSPFDWDWKIFSRKTGKAWDVQAAYEYYQTFENEAMARNMDKHSPGVLHMGAWGGDVVEVYKDAKFMTYMVDVAGIVGIDLKPPTTGSVDPSMLQNQVPGAPGFIPGVDQPGVAPSMQNKTGFLSPNISDKFNFGSDSFYGNSGNLFEQPQYTVNFKAAAVESEPASYDVDLSDLEPSVLALGGIDDVSVDIDLSELNANTLAAADDSIDVDVSAFNTVSEEDAFDAEWGNIADQHEAKNVVNPLFEKVTRVKSNRREALMKHGEVWVPSLSDDLSGSAMMAFENGFMKECTSESQQQKVRAVLSQIRMGNLEEYEAMEDGSTYAKLSEKDMNALRTAMNEPTNAEILASVDAGWGFEEPEQTAEGAMIVDVSRKINQRVGVVKLSA